MRSQRIANPVIGSGKEALAVRDEAHRVDVCLMAVEALGALAGACVPQLSDCVHGSRDKGVLVVRRQAQPNKSVMWISLAKKWR
jgi:hypothetical protein